MELHGLPGWTAEVAVGLALMSSGTERRPSLVVAPVTYLHGVGGEAQRSSEASPCSRKVSFISSALDTIAGGVASIEGGGQHSTTRKLYPMPAKRSIAIIGATIVFTFGGSAAFASAGVFGAFASNSGSTLTIKDTRDDGRNAYTNWNGSSTNRTETSGGINSTSSVTVSPLSNYRACVNISGGPDSCSVYSAAD